jgi:hypothetical protein
VACLSSAAALKVLPIQKKHPDQNGQYVAAVPGFKINQ